jgi:hypothetical protein
MNELTVRKRLLIAQADLHRHCLTLECRRVAEILAPAPGGATREPWWLSAVTTAGGMLLPAKWRGLFGALRLVPPVLRLLRP